MSAVAMRLGRIHLNVSQLDRAARFYTDVLGLAVVRSAPGLVWLSGGNAGYEIALHAGTTEASVMPIALGCRSVGFEVGGRRQIAELCDRLTRSGARLTVLERGDGWSVHTTDPDGNPIEVFCQEAAGAGDPSAWQRAGRPLGLDELADARGGAALTA